jgi:phosphoglycolate phosphatase
MPFNLLVFDLDGTLVESLPDLHTAVNLALSDHGLPTRTLDEVREAIGDGARLLIARCMPAGSPDEAVDPVWSTFRAHYLRTCRDQSYLLPGAAEFLAARASDVPRPRMAILTNKPQAPTDLVVSHLGLDKWIDRAVGGDTALGRKPDPTGLRALMSEFGATTDTTLMIGDGPADLAVAKAAGVPAILLSTGYGKRDELEGLPRLREVANLDELGRIWPQLG